MPRTSWMFNPPNGFYTIRQAAEQIGLDEIVLNAAINHGDLRIQYWKGTMIVSAMEIRKYREGCKYVAALKAFLEKQAAR